MKHTACFVYACCAFCSKSPSYKHKSLMRCSYSFNCSGPDEIAHFKFDRFNTESNYDYLIIGDLKALDNNELNEIDFLTQYSNYTELTSEALIYDNSQPTGNWSTAEDKSNIDIYFFRKVFCKMIKNLDDTETISKYESETKKAIIP